MCLTQNISRLREIQTLFAIEIDLLEKADSRNSMVDFDFNLLSAFNLLHCQEQKQKQKNASELKLCPCMIS